MNVSGGEFETFGGTFFSDRKKGKNSRGCERKFFTWQMTIYGSRRRRWKGVTKFAKSSYVSVCDDDV